MLYERLDRPSRRDREAAAGGAARRDGRHARRRSPSATSRRASTPTGSPRCGPPSTGSRSGASTPRTARPATSGRLGLLDEDNEYNSLLMDWRAPAARPFYTATAASPEGIRRRRHLRTRRREVTAHRRRDPRPRRRPRRGRRAGQRAHQRGRAARRGGRAPHRADGRHRRHDPGRAGRDHPVEAVGRARGAGRPRHRQDRRGAAPRRLPALHPPRPAGPPRRARGGAQPDVPALHRAGAAVAGRDERRAQHRRAALPGSGRATARAAGGRRGQGPGGDGGRDRGGGARPAAAAAAGRCSSSSSSSAVRVDRDVVNAARTRARRSRKPHNAAKRIFHQEAVRLLAEQVARSIVPGGRRLLDAGDLADIRDELKESRELTRELDALWPTLSAEQLLGDLYADPRRLAAATRRLPAADRELLARPLPADDVPAGLRWTPGRRAAARRGRRAARRRRRRGRRPRGRRAARGGHVRPRRARRARPGGGPRPGAAARHRRRSTPTGSPSARPCAATTPRPTAPPPTASGPTGT